MDRADRQADAPRTLAASGGIHRGGRAVAAREDRPTEACNRPRPRAADVLAVACTSQADLSTYLECAENPFRNSGRTPPVQHSKNCIQNILQQADCPP